LKTFFERYVVLKGETGLSFLIIQLLLGLEESQDDLYFRTIIGLCNIVPTAIIFGSKDDKKLNLEDLSKEKNPSKKCPGPAEIIDMIILHALRICTIKISTPITAESLFWKVIRTLIELWAEICLMLNSNKIIVYFY
jgi:hypothetical protein